MIWPDLRLGLLLGMVSLGSIACTNPYSPGQRAAGGALMARAGVRRSARWQAAVNARRSAPWRAR